MSKHTPGPWEVDVESVQDELHVRPTGTGWLLAVIYLDGITAEYHDARANARLIAAAPDLLEALRSIVEFGDGRYVTVEKEQRARAAIAKATEG